MPPAEPEWVPVPNKGLITISVMLATIMQALDTTIANVALPRVQGTLSATQDEMGWVLTSYIVAAAITIPLTGWLASEFGRRKIFLMSIVLFTIASVLCGLATSLPQIVFFRFLQGVGGAALVPLSQAVLFDINPPKEFGRAMSIWGIGVTLGPDPGSRARRLAHRKLQLAVGVLHQPAGGRAGLLRTAGDHAGKPQREVLAVRLLRLHDPQYRHRLPADHARPGPDPRLVLLARDHGGSDHRRPVLLPVHRPHVQQPAAVSEPRALQGPQLRRLQRLHSHDRCRAVRDPRPAAADAAEPIAIPGDPHGPRDHAARYRHAARA